MHIESSQHTNWHKRNERIKQKTLGVYVIFDAYSGNYHQPCSSEMFNKQRSCLYIGEGDIRTRLNSHNNTGRFGKLAREIVYYRVEDQLERKLLERILIYHYKPLFNKEKGLYDRPNEKVEIIGTMNTIRSSVLRNIGILKSFLQLHCPSLTGKDEEEILQEMLNVSSLNIVAEDIRRKADTLARLKDLKEFWDEDMPQYRNKSIEDILSKLLKEAPLDYVEDDVQAAWMSYMSKS
ncbi:hypothetical protein B14911_03369 [Bacillus sp. NRRL B-14911]|nr:hypothetical protein B14911_03369 [Bacillus sp. NRRL B-14911]